MGAAGFLLFIMGIGIFKYMVFAALFALSAGKLSFWLFPNLTEDVGFLESFMPLYDYTYTGKNFDINSFIDSAYFWAKTPMRPVTMRPHFTDILSSQEYRYQDE